VAKIENSITLSKNDLGNEGKGSYILLIELQKEQIITVGCLSTVHFHCGHYAYVGSAMGGFKSRLNRHLKGNKRPRWHIDYLLQRASISNIIIYDTNDRVECAIAQSLSLQFDAIPSFGSSDCKCHSHLFFASTEMKRAVTTILKPLGMRPRLIKADFSAG